MYFSRTVKYFLIYFFSVILLMAMALSGCVPAGMPVPSIETPISLNIGITEPPVNSTQEQVYPYYLPLVTKPDIVPQTIGAVTAMINWVYVDESRVTINYTISGLDLPDGTMLDVSSVRVTSKTVSDIGYGGGGWNALPMENGFVTGNADQFFMYGALDADESPTLELNVDIPIDGASSVFLQTSGQESPNGLQENIPAPDIGIFHFAFSAPVLKSIKLENLNQTVTANNVPMTLKTFILTPSYAQALICFQMPSAVDWGLSASVINMGGRDYSMAGFGLLPGTSGKEFSLNDSERCSSVGFNVPHDESLKSIMLIVPKLLSSVPEVITKERVGAANQKLEGAGIKFDYVNLDHSSNIEILKRPEGATDMDIYPLIWDALADQYEGPWVFTVDLSR